MLSKIKLKHRLNEQTRWNIVSLSASSGSCVLYTFGVVNVRNSAAVRVHTLIGKWKPQQKGNNTHTSVLLAFILEQLFFFLSVGMLFR